MRPELEALRKDTEDLPDGPDKTEALAALAELQRAAEEIDQHERFLEEEKARIPAGPLPRSYVAAPKSKLVLLSVLTALAAPALSFMAFEMIDAGRVVDDGIVYTITANPVLFWWKVAPFALGALFFAFGAVFCVMALVRYPEPPLRRMRAARADSAAPDPLQEANVYASYGRNADAIKVLEEARAAHPERQDLAKRLSELRPRLK